MAKMTYRDAGVNIEAGNELVEQIKPLAQATHARGGVLGGVGGFAALFELPWQNYQQPVMVSATDGVGTKLKVAIDHDQLEGIGIDLVAMCVNDLIVCGADPLFFLDYYATSQLDVAQAKRVIASIAEGCQQGNLALVGGETAEMPGLYQPKEFDLAGFAVGIVEKTKIIDSSQVKPGQQIIGIASSGPHANGFSLIRKLLDQNTLESIEPLLKPTKIYVRAIQAVLAEMPIHAMAHITGGGLLENIPRTLPAYTRARIDQNSWPANPIFAWLAEKAELDQATQYQTFNNGIGMTLCVDAENSERCLKILSDIGEQAYVIGEIQEHDQEQPTVELCR